MGLEDFQDLKEGFRRAILIAQNVMMTKAGSTPRRIINLSRDIVVR